MTNEQTILMGRLLALTERNDEIRTGCQEIHDKVKFIEGRLSVVEEIIGEIVKDQINQQNIETYNFLIGEIICKS